MKRLLAACLTAHIVPDAPSLSAPAWRALAHEVEAGVTKEDILAATATALSTEDSEAVAKRLERAGEFQSALDRLEEEGVTCLAFCEDTYPQRVRARLKDRAPAILFVGGNARLLNAPGVGVVGSRDVDEQGVWFAKTVGSQAVQNALSVVSGAAKGVDLVAMTACLDQGGRAVGYMADSLTKALRTAAIRDALEDGRICLATPFNPSMGFTVQNAMARNKLVYAHAAGTVVVASSEGEGGTWSGAIEAMRLGLLPVFVRMDDHVPIGNVALAKRGCTPVKSPEAVWELLADYSPPQASFGF